MTCIFYIHIYIQLLLLCKVGCQWIHKNMVMVRLSIQPSKLSRMYRVQQQQRTSNKQNGLGDIPKCPWKTPCVYIFVGLCHNFLVGVPLSCWWNSHCCWLAPKFCLIEIHTCCSVKLQIFTGYILVFCWSNVDCLLVNDNQLPTAFKFNSYISSLPSFFSLNRTHILRVFWAYPLVI